MSAKMNVPELRFGEFSGEWVKNNIPITIKSGNTYPLESYSKEGTLLVQGLNIYPNKLAIDKPIHISDEFALGNDVLIKKDDILIGLNRPIINKKLKACLFKYDKAFLYQRAGILEFDKAKLSNIFLFQYLFSNIFIKQLLVELVGSDQPYIKSDLFKKTKNCFPSKPEQEKIASFLSSVDSKIEQLSKKKTLLEQYKKGVMQKIFSQELRFKDDDGSEFPEWVKKKLGKMLEIVIDNRGKTPPVLDYGIPLIEVNAIGNKDINYLKVSKFVDEDTYKNWFRKYLRDGDILFSTVGQTAICSMYDESIKAVIAQNIVGLRFSHEFSLFMYYLLTESKNNHQFKRIEMGAVQPSVKVSQMIHIDFLIPTLEEQTKIATFLSSLDKKIELTNKELNATKEFKKALLQKMFV